MCVAVGFNEMTAAVKTAPGGDGGVKGNGALINQEEKEVTLIYTHKTTTPRQRRIQTVVRTRLIRHLSTNLF